MLAIGVLLIVSLLSVADAQSYLILSSYTNSDCDASSVLPYNVSVQLDQCLNNHDFNKVPCDNLTTCLDSLSSGGQTIAYEDLVNCTGAPSMLLSVFQTYDSSSNELAVKVYPLSRACGDIPLPLHYQYGACASTFALSKSCGISGASVSWV